MVIIAVIVLKHINNGGRLLEIKCAMIAHFIFCPIKNASEKHFEEGRKICSPKGVDMIRKYGIVEV